MTPTPENDEIRELIRKNAATPGGYKMADAFGLPGYLQSGNHTTRMTASGELLRVKVKGYNSRFVSTPAQQTALTAALLAAPKQRVYQAVPHKVRRDKTAFYGTQRGLIRSCILTNAAAPGGTTRADCAHAAPTAEDFRRCMKRLIDAGQIFRRKLPGQPGRFFSNAKDGDDWQAAALAAIPPKKPRPARVIKQAKPKVTKVVKAKPAKPAKSKALKPVRTIQPHQRIVIRQPYSPPAPRADATIIWPARMPECRMMPDRYAVTVPMQRIGTSSWVTL